MDTDLRNLILGGGAVLLLIGFGIYMHGTAEEPQVVEEAIDPKVTQQSLQYLVHASDIAKVVVHSNQVYIGFTKQPEPAVLTATVNQAALNYASAIGRDAYVHGTHERQLASVGTPAFTEYCNAHAAIEPIVGPDGTTVNHSVIAENTCPPIP